jgi:hypothetical protein
MALCTLAAPAQPYRVLLYPDSVVHTHRPGPAGINLNFFMDGGRFPNPKKSVTEALREMRVGYLRYPGGEKSDLYLFAPAPYQKPQPVLARTAAIADYPEVITHGKFTYDPLDFDEFMAMCRTLNAEPVVVVAADCYLADVKEGEYVTPREELIKHAAAWVKYANQTMNYGVKYWMIGNESWNENNPNSTLEIYARDVIDFSKAMKAVDSTILIIPNGSDEEYFRKIIAIAGDYIDRICVSNYGVIGFTRGYESYRDTARVLIWPAMAATAAIEKYASPAQKERLKVIVAEFGTIDWARVWPWNNDMGHAIVNFDMIGQLLLQPEIEFSCFWNTRWIEVETKPGIDHDAIDKDGNVNPTGHALRIWNSFIGPRMLKTTCDEPLISYATSQTGQRQITVFIINKTQRPLAAQIEISGYRIAKKLPAFEYVGRSDRDMAPVWRKRKGVSGPKPILKPTSINVFQFLVEKPE